MTNPTKVTITREAPQRKPPVTVTITCTEERLRYLERILYRNEAAPGKGIYPGLRSAMRQLCIKTDYEITLDEVMRSEAESND